MTSSTITVVVVVLALAGVVAFVLMSGPRALPERVAGAVGLSTTSQSGFTPSAESFHQGEVIS